MGFLIMNRYEERPNLRLLHLANCTSVHLSHGCAGGPCLQDLLKQAPKGEPHVPPESQKVILSLLPDIRSVEILCSGLWILELTIKGTEWIKHLVIMGLSCASYRGRKMKLGQESHTEPATGAPLWDGNYLERHWPCPALPSAPRQILLVCPRI